MIHNLQFGAFWFVCMLSMTTSVLAKELPRPCILVKPSEWKTILDKIETQEWAKNIYSDFIKQLDADIELHGANPEAFLQEMPFDWEKSEPGNRPPFTYTIHLVNGERRNLDNDTKEEMDNARKLIRFLQMGVDCEMAF